MGMAGMAEDEGAVYAVSRMLRRSSSFTGSDSRTSAWSTYVVIEYEQNI
jgi:hypothetical protein